MARKDKSGLVRAGEALQGFGLPLSLPFTAAQRKLAEAASEILANPDDTESAYMARQMVQCTLPHSDPGDLPAWTRTDGNIAFTIQPGFDSFEGSQGKLLGIPYGILPRLLLFWVTTEAVRTQRPLLELGDTLAEFMRELGLDPSRGGKRSDAHRLKLQAERLFSARVTFQQKYPKSREDMLIGRAQLWWTPKQPHQAGLWGSHVELSPDFFKTITAAPVPLDTRALRALKRSPLALDLYALVTYRAFVASKRGASQAIHWADLQQQLGADYTDAKDFHKKLMAALRKIEAVSPRLKIQRQPGGFIILPSSKPAIKPRE